MTLPVPFTLKPMEAEPVDELPGGKGWHYEPKYDGFRCLAFRDSADVRLQSRNQKPLVRYFPELANGLASLPLDRFVIDGEIVLRGQPFETLQLRLHPAASRVEKLAADFPATLIAFDLLVNESGAGLTEKSFAQRRKMLETLMADLGKTPFLELAKATRAKATAQRWLGRQGLDGIVAKPLDLPYRPGERAMKKYKLWHTVDCVVGGLYRKDGTGLVDSLLLGLYDEAGRLNYVGRTSVSGDAAQMTEFLTPLIGGKGFTGRAPGGKSRWSAKERKPVPLKPVLVAEVSADHITGEYMRHGARLLRWRDDKRPQDCTMDQIR